MTFAAILFLTCWAILSATRAVCPYDRGSRLQRWRRFDIFYLIPVGGFFGPGVPETSFSLAVRDILADGRTTGWMTVPSLAPRRLLHLVWNPQKTLYRSRIEAVRTLLETAAVVQRPGGELPPSLLLSEPYLAILRHVAALPRVAAPHAVQFAAVETEIGTEQTVGSLLSAIHLV